MMAAAGERAAAMAAGEKFYWTGRPCLRGHVAWRDTDGGRCVECRQSDGRDFHERNKTKRLKARRNQKRMQAVEDKKPVTDLAVESASIEEQERAWAWVAEQARRLGVKMPLIVTGLKNGWTLYEIERLGRNEAMQLALPVGKAKPGVADPSYDPKSFVNGAYDADGEEAWLSL